MERTDLHYVCRAIVSLGDIQASVIDEYADLYFGGSMKRLLFTFLKITDLIVEEMQSF